MHTFHTLCLCVGRSDPVTDCQLAALCLAVHIYVDVHVCCCCFTEDTSKLPATLDVQKDK